MTWAMFYLACFLVGVTLSVLSFVGGALHLPHFHVHVPHHLHFGTGHVSVPHAGGAQLPVVNFGTIMAFLAWFGATGYLLTRYSALVVTIIMLLAILAGIVGAGIVFWFVAKILLAHDRALDPADYDRIGALGHVNSAIRQGGTGEIIFALEGVRQTCGARSETGEALPRGTEVVITKYVNGIAYVRRYEELAGEKEEETATSN